MIPTVARQTDPERGFGRRSSRDPPRSKGGRSYVR
jgi:hypothetical protein